jgi:hypothetical protein
MNNSERDRHPDRFQHSIYFHKSTTQGDLTAIGTKIQGGISDLFRQTLTSTYFLFNGKYYDQKDGIAMGSPLAPTVAYYFLENIEKQALDMAPKRPTCWYRYMDDTFVMRLHGMEEVRFNSILTAYMQILSSLWKNMAHYHLWMYTYNQETKWNSRTYCAHKTNSYGSVSTCEVTSSPFAKHAVLTTHLNRAKTVCDTENLKTERGFTHNGCNKADFNRAVYHENKTTV